LVLGSPDPPQVLVGRSHRSSPRSAGNSTEGRPGVPPVGRLSARKGYSRYSRGWESSYRRFAAFREGILPGHGSRTIPKTGGDHERATLRRRPRRSGRSARETGRGRAAERAGRPGTREGEPWAKTSSG